MTEAHKRILRKFRIQRRMLKFMCTLVVGSEKYVDGYLQKVRRLIEQEMHEEDKK